MSLAVLSKPEYESCMTCTLTDVYLVVGYTVQKGYIEFISSNYSALFSVSIYSIIMALMFSSDF